MVAFFFFFPSLDVETGLAVGHGLVMVMSWQAWLAARVWKPI